MTRPTNLTKAEHPDTVARADGTHCGSCASKRDDKPMRQYRSLVTDEQVAKTKASLESFLHTMKYNAGRVRRGEHTRY
jgi:hypothetical protein